MTFYRNTRVVEAVQFDGRNDAYLAAFAPGDFAGPSDDLDAELWDVRQDRWRRVRNGDFIVKRSPGVFFVVNEEDFNSDYAEA